MTYSIGSVATLTGLTTHTLRAWEQRYGAIVAARDPAGRRRYAPSDVERLKKLKQLVDVGERIGDIAGLSPTLLDERFSAVTSPDLPLAGKRDKPLRVSLAADARPELRRALLGRRADYVIAETEAEADCVVVDRASIAPEDAAELERFYKVSQGRALVVIYGFARDADLRRLATAGVALVRSPADPNDVIRAIDSSRPRDESAATNPTDAPPVPRFTDENLDRIASVSTDIDCECPQHLVALTRSLRAFEKYSADCENRNDADAAVHAFLYRETVRANLILENALSFLVDYENIEI